VYVQLVHFHPKPRQSHEYARRWQEELSPRARRLPVFRAAYFVGDREANKVNAIFVWDDKPSEALDRTMDDFRERCRDITTGRRCGKTSTSESRWSDLSTGPDRRRPDLPTWPRRGGVRSSKFDQRPT